MSDFGADANPWEFGELGKRTFWQALPVQMRVVGALMLREASTRYGHENIGFFWLMGEPLVLTVGVMILWTISGATHGHDIGVIPFVLTGYSLLTLWRHIVFRSVHAIRLNAGMLFHRNVRILDFLIAIALLETIAVLTAFFIAYLPLVLFGAFEPIRDPLVLIGGWLLMAWLSFGVSLILAGVTELSEAAERFVQPVMYLMLPLSGAFFMVYWLPDSAAQVALWSPLVNVNEMFRSGLFPADVPTKWNALYLLLWCIAITAIGLPIVNKAQRHVRMEQ